MSDEQPVRYMLGRLWENGRLGIVTLAGAFLRREDVERMVDEYEMETSASERGRYVVLKVTLADDTNL